MLSVRYCSFNLEINKSRKLPLYYYQHLSFHFTIQGSLTEPINALSKRILFASDLKNTEKYFSLGE